MTSSSRKVGGSSRSDAALLITGWPVLGVEQLVERVTNYLVKKALL